MRVQRENNEVWTTFQQDIDVAPYCKIHLAAKYVTQDVFLLGVGGCLPPTQQSVKLM